MDRMTEFLKEMSRKAGGCAAAVYRGGRPLFVGCEGMASGGIPADEHTAFRLASMTKPLTAAAALLCAEEGLLSLDDPVSRYLPAFRAPRLAVKTAEGYTAGAQTECFTVRALLTHSAGVGAGGSGDVQLEAVKPREGDTLASAVERYAEVLLEFAPGTAQMYSPVIGFDIVARIVEIVSGMPYGEFLGKRITGPLGMDRTSYLLTDYPEGGLASTYTDEGGVLREERPESNFGDFPAGYTGGGAGLISTLEDYVRFAETLRLSRKGEGLLSRESALELSRPQLAKEVVGIEDGSFNWGLGVRVLPKTTEYQPLPAGSFGWSGAYGTHFWVDPANDLVAVYMHNSHTYGGAGAPHTVAFERAVTEEFISGGKRI